MTDELRIGIIGYDTSHVPAFTKVLNDPQHPFHVPGGRVVCGYPSFSPDVVSSYSRVDGFKADMAAMGVIEVSSLEELVDQVDAVLLESVDGRRHLDEVRPVVAARKPVYVDKPMAASYVDAAEIMRLAQENGCPLFSCSSLRFDVNISALKQDAELGSVLGCDAFSPASLEPTNPGLFWYGVHGVEILYTFMGAGCEKVRCTSTDKYDIAVGVWPNGRVGVMRGMRGGRHDYGATVYGENKIAQTLQCKDVPLYSQLLKQIIPFFRGGPAPVAAEETLEMMAFMQAALVSAQGGYEVVLNDVR